MMWSGRRIGLAVVLALVVVAGVSLVFRLGSGDIGPGEVSAPSSESHIVIDTGAEVGSTTATGSDGQRAEQAPPPSPNPPAFEHEPTAAGARSAAIAYLESTEDAVTLRPAEAAAWARESASAAYAYEFGADTERRMVELWQTIPEGVTVRLAPIETRVIAGQDGWLVSVWFVEAITIGSEGVVDDWRTASYEMVWEDNSWKIDGFVSERGPMPGRGTNPTSMSAPAFEALLAEFDDEGLS